MEKKILIIAGESSGDIHGAALSRSLIELKPGIKIFGIGGDEMRKSGVHILQDNKDMAVVGILEVFGKIGLLYNVFKKIKNEIFSGQYSALILIDYPTFNMILACLASKQRIPVFYFIAPQIWVWGKSRIKLLARTVNRMFVILPFEEKIYKHEGMDVEFVGHPFLDRIKTTMDKEEASKKFCLNKNQKIIGLLPGSRSQEIKTLFPVMLDSARKIKMEIPSVQFVLPLAKTVKKDEISGQISESGLDIKVIEDFTYDAISIADLLIVASGSVTLEAAVLKKPMVIIYKLNYITYLLARLICHIHIIGLVNIIAGKEVVPELHQDNVTSDNITAWVLKAVKDRKYYEEVKQELAKIELLLGKKGASQTTAKGIINYLYEEKSL